MELAKGSPLAKLFSMTVLNFQSHNFICNKCQGQRSADILDDVFITFSELFDILSTYPSLTLA